MVRQWVAVAAVVAWSVAGGVGVARGEGLAGRPYAAVRYAHQVTQNPPQQIFIAAIDLRDPNVEVVVSRGGADPDGAAGEWQTTLMPPTAIADREKFDVVINGDFFSVYNAKDAEGAAAQKEFVAKRMAKVSGPAETGDEVWAEADKPRPMFVIDGQGRPSIAEGRKPPRGSRETIAGSHVLIKGGQVVAPASETGSFVKGPHPRTAVGIAEGGRTLLLVVADGRSKIAKGMSLQELAAVLKELGAHDAINLDGGGSSMLGIRDPKTGKMVIANKPSDGRERPVGNVLGVRVKGRGATP